MSASPYRQRNYPGWCECSECGRRFTGLRGFDDHRITLRGVEYDWRCATDAELEAKGYAQDARGWWGSTRSDARFSPATATETVPEAAIAATADG
jgi:hypothetical protein